MYLNQFRNRVNNIIHNIEEEIADLMETAKDFEKDLAWIEKVATMKAGDIVYRKPNLNKYCSWQGKNIVIGEVIVDNVCDCGVAIKEEGDFEFKSANWYEPAKPHSLKFVTVANGAGKGVCECGCWESKVSDDGLMFTDEYYSQDDIKIAYTEHLKEVFNG